MITESALQAQSILRDTSQFSWYVIPLLLIVLYVYFQEAEQGNWSRILAALAFWGMDWFNEIWNREKTDARGRQSFCRRYYWLDDFWRTGLVVIG